MRNQQRLVMALIGLSLAAVVGASIVSVGGPGSRLYPQSSSSSSSSGGGNWQLEDGHFQQSIHDLDLWYPRPDSDTQAWAYHRRAPTVYDRVIPLGIVGGCPPWHVTIESGPPDMTVNNDYYTTGDPLALTIPEVSVGEWTIEIAVEDQCGNSISPNPQWSFEGIDRDNTTYFVHLADGSGGSENGTSSNPFRDLGDIVGPNSSTSTHAGKQVICSGTHTVSGQSAQYGSNGTRLTLNSNKPQVWVAATVGGCTFQGSATNENGSELAPTHTNFVASGITWENPLVDEVSGEGDPGLRNVFVHGNSSAYAYGGFFFNTFECTSIPEGEDDGSNPAAIFYSSGGTGGYTAIIGNSFNDCDDMALVMWFDASHQVILSNTITGGDATEGFFVKGGHDQDDYFFAFNVGTGNGGPFSVIQAINPDAPWSRTGIEFMHNRWVSSGTCLRLIGASDSTFEVVSKRNSWKCTNHLFNSSNLAAGSFTLDFDSIEHTGSIVVDQGAGATISVGENMDAGTSGILDDTTGLQEGGPDGIHGAEIAWNAANDHAFDVRLAA